LKIFQEQRSESVMAMAIRSDVLRELMNDKEFVEKLAKAKQWHQVLELFHEFVKKKGYKVADVYLK
jgi:hypothetical protein